MKTAHSLHPPPRLAAVREGDQNGRKEKLLWNIRSKSDVENRHLLKCWLFGHAGELAAHDRQLRITRGIRISHRIANFLAQIAQPDAAEATPQVAAG